MSEKILAEVKPSQLKQAFGIGGLVFLGLLLIWVGITAPTRSYLGQIVLILAGAGGMWFAYRMYVATSVSIELTETELRESSGRILTKLTNINRVDRGLFAFKPTNGFVVYLDQPAERSWSPGLWWCTGRKIGIGGITAAHQTKFMAEILISRLKPK
ncbi:hypothetical protein [Parasulfitobacter algicola]|uniref:PH domain-containing protein n=1 Tax=Parasulfitobacter algicola TaxID=2614809 RepID=A0ABX2IMZ0_9RHOB|nr:hypothetical protein [Sulfitobacter algicola]NSX53910.1 hypothetical protein [Sulfitobacter algicola]